MASNKSSKNWQFNLSLGERMGHMLDKEIATDVIFKVSSQTKELATIKAHKVMLISASPVFEAMFCGLIKENDEVKISDIDTATFKEMLKYIYTDDIELSGDNVMQILNAAKKYQLITLQTRCTEFLEKELDSKNACSILDHCRFFEETELENKCMKLIEESIEEVFNSPGFKSISAETLSLILDSDKLSMKEVDIFQRCYQWAMSRCGKESGARKELGEALYKIRFPTMAPDVFVDIICATDVLTKEEQFEILRYISSAKKVEKPDGFCCDLRQQEPTLKKGDRVRLRKDGEYPATSGLGSVHTLKVTYSLFIEQVEANAIKVRVKDNYGQEYLYRYKIPIGDVIKVDRT